MTGDVFSRSVDMGLRLSKRIYYGKEYKPSMSAPKPEVMTKSLSSCSSTSSFRPPEKHHPTAPMVYAVITDPNVVDNPDIRSYQPHVHGRCNPPALIPLHMHGISMNVECFLDTAFVTVSGSWRMHCVTASACCDCRIAIPMGHQGSVLEVEAESNKRSYFTKLMAPAPVPGDQKDKAKVDGFLMKHNTYTLKIPQVEGGSMIHVKVRWCQKLLFEGDELCLSVPFTFPTYVLPLDNNIPMREKVMLNLNSPTGTAITCTFASHPLKNVQQEGGEASFIYEAEVFKWSTQDFYVAYSVCSNDIFGGLLLQHPSLHDYDQRDMFCFYLFPGTNNATKHFRKEVVFLLDISGSMRDVPLEKSKYAITASLSKLNQGDLFNIIAFNDSIHAFSSSLELATEETITNATEWMWKKLLAEGGTNLMCPLKQAIDTVGKGGESIPLIFLITDGTVEDERDICNMMKCCLDIRICTFGIGSYCNHYFLQMLSYIGRGYYGAAYDVDTIGERMQQLFDTSFSPMLANVTLDALQNLKSYQLHPFRIPDLSSGSPLIISGRCNGKFPESVKARGLLADLSTCVIDIKVRKITNINLDRVILVTKALKFFKTLIGFLCKPRIFTEPTSLPLDRVCAMREVDILTAQAWLNQNTRLQEKVVKLSIQRGVPSEYTHMILVQKDKIKPQTLKSLLLDEKCSEVMKNQNMIWLRNVCVGFGNLKATTANLPPGIEEAKLNEAAKMVMKAASSCWGLVSNSYCWKCLMQVWSHLRNDQCAIAVAQLCTALACLEALDCCCDLCDSCIDLCQ